jgi:hypothetical protein
MFNSFQHASAFREYFLSFDWTEKREYEVAEVFMNSVREKKKGQDA